MVQARADVYLHSTLAPSVVESAHLRPAEDLDGTLAGLREAVGRDHGREATLCVMPFGQLTVPRPNEVA